MPTLACCWEDFFWFAFGDLSPIILIFYCRLIHLRRESASLNDGTPRQTKVTFDAFAIGSPKPVLTGTLENISDAPQKGTLKVQFVNDAGIPVSTQTTDFALGPKEKKPFSVTGDGAAIVAYKYDPIP